MNSFTMVIEPMLINGLEMTTNLIVVGVVGLLILLMFSK